MNIWITFHTHTNRTLQIIIYFLKKTSFFYLTRLKNINQFFKERFKAMSYQKMLLFYRMF